MFKIKMKARKLTEIIAGCLLAGSVLGCAEMTPEQARAVRGITALIGVAPGASAADRALAAGVGAVADVDIAKQVAREGRSEVDVNVYPPHSSTSELRLIHIYQTQDNKIVATIPENTSGLVGVYNFFFRQAEVGDFIPEGYTILWMEGNLCKRMRQVVMKEKDGIYSFYDKNTGELIFAQKSEK